ncbi:hypothetical protein JQ543_21150 [Bradyrhizobium diazoefficiens]|nr:hypothetical protein [Bradyrhizobium diazoefficiens]MBR0850267.1 hypothetical protein [Bradyrhizobium diazoefficiens]
MKRLLATAAIVIAVASPAQAEELEPITTGNTAIDAAVDCSAYATYEYTCRAKADKNDPTLGKLQSALAIMSGGSLIKAQKAGVSKATFEDVLSKTIDWMGTTVAGGSVCQNMQVLRDRFERSCRPSIDKAYKDTLITIDALTDECRKKKSNMRKMGLCE